MRAVSSRAFRSAVEPVIGGTDRAIHHPPRSPRRWPLGVKVGAAVAVSLAVLMLVLWLFAGGGVRTLRLPVQQVTIGTVERGVFHDIIPLHATVVPRETV